MYHFDNLHPAIQHLLKASDAIRRKMAEADLAGRQEDFDALNRQQTLVITASNALLDAMKLTPRALQE
jgi:hypothetical protein